MKKIATSFSRIVILVLFVFVSQTVLAEKDTVVNANNAGLGSLRAAIDSCNNRISTLDTIIFLIPAPPFTINLASSLPAITDAVFINGYSQPGSFAGQFGSRLILININGTAMPGGDIFTVSANDVTIAGLAIYKAPVNGNGIRTAIGVSNLFIWGNFIGTNNTGITTTLGNAQNGIVINENGGGSVTGIIIGTNGDGVADINEGNLISCNGQDGIFLWRVQNSRISGNIIGLNQVASGPGYGNLRNGVLITVGANNNVIGTDGDGTSDDREQNFISGNGQRGILISAVSDNNVVAGNVVGLDIGANPAGNGLNGIQVFNGSNNRIGTNGDGVSDQLEANVVCSNTGSGIIITDDDFFGFNSNSNNNIIAGNYIGTEPVSNQVRGNTANGVYIVTGNGQSANNNLIGTNNDGVSDNFEVNIITNNNKGIVIAPIVGFSTSLGNKISGNSIHDNTQLGIDLNDDGITANDNGDGDAGPNELFNVPFISQSKISAGNLVISGITRPSSILEFYIADAGGEGQTFLFRAQEGNTLNGIADDSAGTASYSDVNFGIGTDERFGFTVPLASIPATINSGTIITALAIKAVLNDSSSSEFGPIIITSLPVRLLEFKANLQNDAVYLSWITAQEINNSHFDVERSDKGVNFKKLGTVAARGGQSNAYSYVDNGPLSKVNFYRLKQVDKDGKATYSKTLVIRSDLDKIVAKVSPNPFTSVVNIAFGLSKEENINIRLYDQMGRAVKNYNIKGTTGINTVNLSDLGSLPTGNYTIELKGENISFKQQVVKQ